MKPLPADVPALVFIAALEAPPIGYLAAATDGQACRLGGWLANHRAELHESLDDLIDLAVGECAGERAA